MDEDLQYSLSLELKHLAHKIVERYFYYLGHVDIENIFFAERDATRPKKAPIVQLMGVSAPWVVAQLMQANKALYCLFAYSEDWAGVSPAMREWLVFQALLGVSPLNDGKIQKPDVQDFGIIIEFLGPYWKTRQDLPSLLDTADGKPLPLPLPPDNTDEGNSVKGL